MRDFAASTHIEALCLAKLLMILFKMYFFCLQFHFSEASALLENLMNHF